MADIAKQFKKGRAEAATPDEPDVKVAVYVPEGLHKAAKLHAVEHGVALSNLYVALLQQHLAASDTQQRKALDAALALTTARRARR